MTDLPEHPIDTGRLNILRKMERSDSGLNVGCGITRFRKKLNVDIQNYHSNADVIADVRNLSMFKDNSIPEIVFADVIEHIPKEDVPKALSEIYRVLKEGGCLLLSTPFKSKIAIALDPVWWMHRHRHYDIDDMMTLLEDAGFDKGCCFTAGKIPFGVVTLAYAVNWVFRRKRAALFGNIVSKAYDGYYDIDNGNKGATLYILAPKVKNPIKIWGWRCEHIFEEY